MQHIFYPRERDFNNSNTNNNKYTNTKHCVKSLQIRSFFWSECGKIPTRKNSVFGHFSRSDSVVLYGLNIVL